MAGGVGTRSQARSQALEPLLTPVGTQGVSPSPNNVVSEPVPTPANIHGEVLRPPDVNQLQVAMEQMTSQLRWVMEEVRNLHHERVSEREETLRRGNPEGAPGFSPPSFHPQSREAALHYSSPFPFTNQRPPMITIPPLLHHQGHTMSPTIPSIPNFFATQSPGSTLPFNNNPPISFTHHSHNATIPPGWSSGFPSSSNGGWSPTQNSYQLKPKPEFPIFKGKEVYAWIYRVEQLLDYYEVAMEQRVKNAALYLDEGPLQWYLWWLKTRNSTLTWGEFL